MTDVKPAPGMAREIGPSLREQLLADPVPPPAALLEESYEFLGDEDIPYAVYTSEAYARAEEREVWGKQWQWACHVDHIPAGGRYYVYEVAGLSAIVVRTEAGAIKAFANACMHRGTQLKQPSTCGKSKNFRCPYHGWTWSLDGELIDLPQRWDFPHVTEESHNLVEIPCDVWEGFVFVNFDVNAAPLSEYLGVLPRHWADWGLADRYIDTHVRKRLPCNWKAGAEAFLEAYHVRETHATGKLGDEVVTQYDVFEPNVSRFIHTTGLNSPLRDPQLTEQQLWERSTMRRGVAQAPPLAEGMRARDMMAKVVQERMGEQYGRDFSHLSQSLTLDSIEYFVFPNAFFFPGLQLSMIYRFRPDPESVDHCFFDLVMMRPRPGDGRKAPAPPDVMELSIDESYSLAEGLGALGAVYDQDTANMAAQTRGFRSSMKRGQTLGNYQEVRARWLELRVRDLVGAFPTD